MYRENTPVQRVEPKSDCANLELELREDRSPGVDPCHVWTAADTVTVDDDGADSEGPISARGASSRRCHLGRTPSGTFSCAAFVLKRFTFSMPEVCELLQVTKKKKAHAHTLVGENQM
jgi:hypothetical protein